jgi:diacylglycerol kinase family enzyme
MRTRFFIIRDPRASRYGRYVFNTTLENLRDAGSHVESVSVERREDGARLAREAMQSGAFDAIVGVGGERMIHNVAAGLVGGETPLGVIPTGTGNVFASELGYSFAPFALARTLQTGSVEHIPVGEVNGEVFLSLVSVGCDAEAVRHFTAANPRFLGRASYILPVLRALAGRPSRSLVVETESGRHRAHWVIISRTKRYAGNLSLAPEAGLAKPGMFVICFRGAGRKRRLRHLLALVTGLLQRDPHISIEGAQSVTITGDSQCAVQIDGQFKGMLPLKIGLHSERLGVIMPNGSVC